VGGGNEAKRSVRRGKRRREVWRRGVCEEEWVVEMRAISYGVASVSSIDQIIGLFCKTALLKRRYSAKATCNFIDPTDRSHPIKGNRGRGRGRRGNTIR